MLYNCSCWWQEVEDMPRKPLETQEKANRAVAEARRTAARIGRDELIMDTLLPGFGIRVRPGGSAAWIFHRTPKSMQMGKRLRVQFGDFDAMPIADAIAQAHRIVEKPNQVKSLQEKRTDIRTFSDGWLEYKSSPDSKEWQKLTEISHRNYTSAWELYIKPVFGELPLNELTNDMVSLWHKRIAKPVAANRALATLSGMCKFFIYMNYGGMKAPNPCHDLGRNEEKGREVEVYTREWPMFGQAFQIARQHMDHSAAVDILLCLFLTSSRESDLRLATRETLEIESDFSRIRSTVKEGKDKRWVYPGPRVLQIIKHYLGPAGRPHDYIFPSVRGFGPVTIDTALETFWAALKALGHHEPGIRVHDFRHVWRSQAGEAKLRSELAETLMGHSISTNLILLYGRPQPAALSAAAGEVEDLLWSLIFPEGCPWWAEYDQVKS